MAGGTQLWLDAQLGQQQAQEKGGKEKDTVVQFPREVKHEDGLL